MFIGKIAGDVFAYQLIDAVKLFGGVIILVAKCIPQLLNIEQKAALRVKGTCSGVA